jgi:hypothetical protein
MLVFSSYIREVTQSSLLITDERWRRIGWKNICKLWLQERTPGTVKRGGWMRFLKGKISERIQQLPSDPRMSKFA